MNTWKLGRALGVATRGPQLARPDARQHPVRVDAEGLGQREGGVALVVLSQAQALRLKLHGRRRPPELASQRLDRCVVEVGLYVGLVFGWPGPVLGPAQAQGGAAIDGSPRHPQPGGDLL